MRRGRGKAIRVAAGLMDAKEWVFHEAAWAMQRRKFNREFKIEAVQLVSELGVLVAQVGRDLDVHENVLRRWVKEFGSIRCRHF